MELNELFTYRHQLLDDSKDAEGYLSDSGLLESALPWLNETKYIDNTDVTNIYCSLDKGAIKANAYTLNESGERLQIFLINESSLDIEASDDEIMVSQKQVYEKQFIRAINFVKKSIKKQLDEYLQDADPAWVLVHQLGSSEFIDQIDAIEFFLITATATVELRGAEPSAKNIEFEDESIPVTYATNRDKKSKSIIIIKNLIDLNFLYTVQISQGSRYPLTIDFSDGLFKQDIPCLHVASETSFDSYLCALPATLLARLYKRHSSRLLEKNVRSFLQLNNSVNKGMQDTIRRKPEKFIAFNNGLTITATRSEVKQINSVPHLKSLTDFQIVNGGQTTATLFFSEKQGLNIDHVKIMAKINVAKEATDEVLDDLISDISTYSNAQSKVSKVDLRARSPQLIKLKSLSESVLTVSGKKWFFERAKGEYATMVRINYSKKSQIEKAFPKERRFTKEDLAKYYCSWGDIPYAVKKGGEKIFRFFIEDISGEGKTKKQIHINRAFYEDLIARIILFRSLEKLYGSGKNSLGQIRSAVVPYTLSALFSFTTGNKKTNPFDLQKIWRAEKLDDELENFFLKLMRLINRLIKKYSKSDDIGEYSKKPELWEDIYNSKELLEFMDDTINKIVIRKYSTTIEEIRKREKDALKEEVINFELLKQTAEIFDAGINFYKKLSDKLNLSSSQNFKLNAIISSIQAHKPIEQNCLEFEKQLIKDVSIQHSELLKFKSNSSTFTQTCDFIIKKYNSAISNDKGIQATFDALREMARNKGVSNYLVFSDIGRLLANAEEPTILHLIKASEYYSLITNKEY